MILHKKIGFHKCPTHRPEYIAKVYTKVVSPATSSAQTTILQGQSNKHILSTSSTKSPCVEEKTLQHIQAAKSIQDVLDVSTFIGIHYPSEISKEAREPDGLSCFTSGPEVGESPGRTPGVLHYDWEKGESFKLGRKQPLEFSNLKNKTGDHLKSQYHELQVKKDIEEKAEKKKFQPRNVAVGKVLGRNAYKSIVENKSQQSYEREVQ
jgi:hypothetical protein